VELALSLPAATFWICEYVFEVPTLRTRIVPPVPAKALLIFAAP
jgi:CBS-domain-containing membrane protein